MATIFESSVAISLENHLYYRLSIVPNQINIGGGFAGIFLAESVIGNIILSDVLVVDTVEGVRLLIVYDNGDAFFSLSAPGDFTAAIEPILRLGFQYDNIIYNFLLGDTGGGPDDQPYFWTPGIVAEQLYAAIIADPTLELTIVLFDLAADSPIVPNTLDHIIPPVNLQGQLLDLDLSLSRARISAPDPNHVFLQGELLDLNLQLSTARLHVINPVNLRGQSLDLGLELSQAQLKVIDPVILRGRILDLNLEILPASTSTKPPPGDVVGRPGRSTPFFTQQSILRKSDDVIAPRSAAQVAGTFPAFCPSKRILLGTKIYPFSGLDFIGNFELSQVSWRYRRGNSGFSAFRNVVLGNFTDILAATRFTSQDIDEFGKYLYEIELTNEFGMVTTLLINVECYIIAGSSKNVQRDLTFRPFADFMLAANADRIQSIAYGVSGDVDITRTGITREILFSGTHEIDQNAAYLYDGRKDFNLVTIVVGSDILFNITDGCVGVISGISADGHRVNVDMLIGGINNNFSVGDEYQILNGANLSDVARDFELFINANSISLVKLYVTDQNNNVSTGAVLVQCD